jgi:phosphoglycerate dehydrogenase-like enzyme
MRHALDSLAAAVLAAALLVWPVGPLHANGPLVHHPDVTMYTPTPHVAAVEPPQPVVHKVVVKVLVDALALDRAYRRAVAWEYRKDRIRLALGHRYTGFIKMYRGPRYPL